MDVRSFLEKVRLEIDAKTLGSAAPRFTDEDLLSLAADAVERISHMLVRNAVYLGLRRVESACDPQSGDFAAPADFLVDFALYDTQAKTKLVKRGLDDWETLAPSGFPSDYLVFDGRVGVKGTPGDRVFRLYYWPLATLGGLDDPMPWDDRLNLPLRDYVALRCKNIDEMNAGFDLQLMQDLENAVLNTFVFQSPVPVLAKGWMA